MFTMRASDQFRWATVLAGFAVWATAVPWLAKTLGLELAVSTRLEVVDHVVPGVVLLAGAALLATRGDLSPADGMWLGVGSIAFLTGLWITATHIPLIPDAISGLAPWGTALLHLSAGPPILALGLWMLVDVWRAEAPDAQR